MSDRTNGGLDKAVIAYRDNPTPENRAVLIAAQRAHADAFAAEQTAEFQRRTH